MKEIPPRYKKRFILKYGKVRKGDDGWWTFIPMPGKECPVVRLSGRSQWDTIETVYDIIKGYA